MPRSSLFSRAVTQIVDDQPKSCHHSVNTSIPAVSRSKRAGNGKNDESRRPLVGYSDSEVYEQQGKDYEIMGSEETTHLLCGKSFYEAIRINESKGRQKDTGLTTKLSTKREKHARDRPEQPTRVLNSNSANHRVSHNCPRIHALLDRKCRNCDSRIRVRSIDVLRYRGKLSNTNYECIILNKRSIKVWSN